MEKVYVQAVMELVSNGSDIEQVLGNLRAVMKARGHSKALPAVLRDIVRAFEQEIDENLPTITVARAADVTALTADIKTALVTLGATGSYTTLIDDTIIGGIIATYNHRQIDQSYRTKLVTLYQSITN
jgi:F0F1-type ATP synthase delta subunit